MEILIRSAVIIHQESPFHLKKKDIHILDGVIIKIADKIELNDKAELKIIEAGNLHVSSGWFDMKAAFCDPGYEQKEDLITGMAAAAAGGFTGVLVMPSTNPCIQTKAGIEYLINKGKGNAVEIFPAGALTLERQGKELTEMYDMKLSGAVAFTDDKRTVDDAGVMLRALQYGRQIGSVIITFSSDKGIAGNALVNESINTTRLGLKGIPALAEEMVVARDISLCEYAGGALHFSLISTAGTVELIRQAKKKGLKVTADASAYHLLLDDSLLGTFDTNYKTKPPLRSVADRESLIEGLLDGTIDAIASDHSPQDVESKRVEFDFADFGMIGLETAFCLANTVLRKRMKITEIVQKFTNGRSVTGLESAAVTEGATANLTLFDPETEWIFSEAGIKSKSNNTPFLGMKFTGRVIGIINNGIFQ
jgi:dihydroorotase